VNVGRGWDENAAINIRNIMLENYRAVGTMAQSLWSCPQ